eukprot:TRINITY_DN4716_c0_g1_i2.p1 TRINITY_DN4716_c0_g1~~TRINITY_DN4716_c0_g1_i2.p1  ORF type:complete len:311 (-),score=39.21 TRINITY_DN4716_c0_g1_i2:330-1262(-)
MLLSLCFRKKTPFTETKTIKLKKLCVRWNHKDSASDVAERLYQQNKTLGPSSTSRKDIDYMREQGSDFSTQVLWNLVNGKVGEPCPKSLSNFMLLRFSSKELPILLRNLSTQNDWRKTIFPELVFQLAMKNRSSIEGLMSILGSLPLRTLPDFNVNINEKDLICSEYLSWKQKIKHRDSNNIEDNLWKSSEVGELIGRIFPKHEESKYTMPLIPNLTTQYWIQYHGDFFQAVYSGSVVLASLVGYLTENSDKVSSNEEVGKMIKKYHEHVKNYAIKNYRSEDPNQKVWDRGDDMALLSLLIAETSERRGR